MRYLTILNEAPYGNERAYNGLRLAINLAKRDDVELSIFLMADAVGCARAGQKTPDGYYNIERMLVAIINKQGQVKACGTCEEARGLEKLSLIDGIQVSTMSQLAQWVVESDKALTF